MQFPIIYNIHLQSEGTKITTAEHYLAMIYSGRGIEGDHKLLVPIIWETIWQTIWHIQHLYNQNHYHWALFSMIYSREGRDDELATDRKLAKWHLAISTLLQVRRNKSHYH